MCYCYIHNSHTKYQVNTSTQTERGRASQLPLATPTPHTRTPPGMQHPVATGVVRELSHRSSCSASFTSSPLSLRCVSPSLGVHPSSRCFLSIFAKEELSPPRSSFPLPPPPPSRAFAWVHVCPDDFHGLLSSQWVRQQHLRNSPVSSAMLRDTS